MGVMKFSRHLGTVSYDGVDLWKLFNGNNASDWAERKQGRVEYQMLVGQFRACACHIMCLRREEGWKSDNRKFVEQLLCRGLASVPPPICACSPALYHLGWFDVHVLYEKYLMVTGKFL